MLLDLAPHALHRQLIELALVDHALHQPHGFRRNRKPQGRITGSKSSHSQHTQGIFDERIGHMAQHPGLQVGLAAKRVLNLSRLQGAGDGVDGQIPAHQVLLKRDGRIGYHLKPAVPQPHLTLGACQGVFLSRVGVKEHGEVPTHGLEPTVEHGLGRLAHDHEVPVLDRQAQQFVAHRPAHQVSFHFRLHKDF